VGAFIHSIAWFTNMNIKIMEDNLYDMAISELLMNMLKINFVACAY
jgi:hypothetical protein